MRWILLCLIFSSPAFATKVLLIESYHSEYPWDQSYVEGITSTLIDTVEFDTFQMDTKRVPKADYAEKADQAYVKYQEYQPNIVILGDDNALSFMLPKLFNEPISIVFLGINSNPRKLLSKYRGQAKVTGVLERPLFTKSLGELDKLFDVQNFKVKILFDSGVTSQIAKSYIDKQYTLIRDNLGIEVDSQAITTQEEWQGQVLGAKQDEFTVIIVGLYQTLVDAQGNNVPAEQVINWTNQHSELPIFAFWDFAVGKNKAMGGVVLFGYSQGEQAAKLVNQIIEHGHNKPIPIVTGNQGKAIYSEPERMRWDLTLPSYWDSID
ncbi:MULTISPECIES: ABC transporter substrate-binding protein [Vibrio]|uniref:Sugar ABC transporter ATPase n=1 Tax=Vibrio bivalvicida TaxID=1276888 RepID=A0A177XY22_9VIBR|nr:MULTISPECIES: sugar ABC transporter ATPase [Vibrio]KLN66630.1 sugar ABC transporter ATPase [Vibrio sp. VPAP30]OAJ93488.1 hypothetical protein APB76_16175 [Vibrio bivalvicida]